VLSGDDATSGLLAFAGAHGVISVVSNIAPRVMSDMMEAIHAGNLEAGRSLHQKVAEFHRIVFEQSNPIPIKGLVSRLGFGSGDLRLPLLAMTDTEIDRLWTECQELGVSR
jgi:4-hydroxy-tetrahydrodipicolinate synthase